MECSVVLSCSFNALFVSRRSGVNQICFQKLRRESVTADSDTSLIIE
jgi:hypothetical protein